MIVFGFACCVQLIRFIWHGRGFQYGTIFLLTLPFLIYFLRMEDPRRYYRNDFFDSVVASVHDLKTENAKRESIVIYAHQEFRPWIAYFGHPLWIGSEKARSNTDDQVILLSQNDNRLSKLSVNGFTYFFVENPTRHRLAWVQGNDELRKNIFVRECITVRQPMKSKCDSQDTCI
ncbi:MAG: hypothetical protein R3A11_03195 [Bdellovibrionota bacterium]